MTREEAVAAARQGRTEEAIAALRKLFAEGSQDPLVGYDLAVILTWVNRLREATDAFEWATAKGGEVPTYVLAPMVRAYRHEKRFAEAERWAREGQRRYPMDSTWAKLLALALADQKRGKEATELLQPWAATQRMIPRFGLPSVTRRYSRTIALEHCVPTERLSGCSRTTVRQRRLWQTCLWI